MKRFLFFEDGMYLLGKEEAGNEEGLMDPGGCFSTDY